VEGYAVAVSGILQRAASGLYTYPDLSVVCGEARFADDWFDTLSNPILLVEILSPSTEDYGRGRKAGSGCAILASRGLMSTLAKPFVTPEEYLELERKAEFKSEYHDGKIYAMSGVSRWHDWINSQLSGLIYQHLRGSQCGWFTANMRVLVEASGLYTYPDLSVVCGKAQFADDRFDTLTNPILLVEILSPSTEDYDRGRKAAMYRKIPSLQELLLIAQGAYEVELHRRGTDGTWSLIEVSGLDATIELRSIGYTLRLSELYERVRENR
jgi:Uma2 family endonuclease